VTMNDTSTIFYVAAKSWMINAGLGSEIACLESQRPGHVSESTFLAEAAWVIYNSGFREATVRKHFDYISLCFCDWSSAREIVAAGSRCVNSAMLAIANRRKHEAVLEVATRISAVGFDEFRSAMLESPLTFLQQLPFIGPVTAAHLAKNIGFDLAKPDRHLVRLQKHLGYADVEAMCAHFAAATGDSVRVVDLVLWRYLERHGHEDDDA
jgi:hypothetical protein